MESPITLFPMSEDYGSMYDQFYRWEQDHQIVTMPKVRDYLFPGQYKKARLHVQRYWSWFLICVDNTKKPYDFKVEGICNYPRAYFIEAHNKDKMHFFYHFAKSLEAYEEVEKFKKYQAIERQALQSEQATPEQLTINLNLSAILEATRDEDLDDTESLDDGTDTILDQDTKSIHFNEEEALEPPLEKVETPEEAPQQEDTRQPPPIHPQLAPANWKRRAIGVGILVAVLVVVVVVVIKYIPR